MSDQPEALRLADRLDLWGDQGDLMEAAAELRRLHGENDLLKAERDFMQVAGQRLRAECDAVEAERDAAVKALTELLADMALEYAGPGYDVYQVRMGAVAEAVAAIDAARGET